MLSPSGNSRASGHQGVVPRVLQDDSHCSESAKHALVLGSS